MPGNLPSEHGYDDVTVLGLTRAYSTRHGAGPFPTWDREFTASLVNRGNPPNDWQGSLRAGPLDLVLLEYAARICHVDALAVTCLDQLPARPRVATHYADLRRVQHSGQLARAGRADPPARIRGSHLSRGQRG